MRLSRREKGEGQFGCLVEMILLALALFVALQDDPVKVKNASYAGDRRRAKSAGSHKDDHILAAILAKAREDNLPVTEQNVEIKRGSRARSPSTSTTSCDRIPRIHLSVAYPPSRPKSHLLSEETDMSVTITIREKRTLLRRG